MLRKIMVSLYLHHATGILSIIILAIMAYRLEKKVDNFNTDFMLVILFSALFTMTIFMEKYKSILVNIELK